MSENLMHMIKENKSEKKIKPRKLQPSKIAFVIAPIGEPDSEIRKRSDDILTQLIKPVVKSFGYTPLRADYISKTGDINDQVLEHVYTDPLVIADLTTHNPNVFYELAFRHLVEKPAILLINAKEKLPFDLSHMRIIKLLKEDWSGLKQAKQELRKQIKNLEKKTGLETPLSPFVARFLYEKMPAHLSNEKLLATFEEPQLRKLVNSAIGALRGRTITNDLYNVVNKHILEEMIGVKTDERTYDIELSYDFEFEVPLVRVHITSSYVASNESPVDKKLFRENDLIEKGTTTIPATIAPMQVPRDPKKVFTYVDGSFCVDSKPVSPETHVEWTKEKKKEKLVEHSATLDYTIKAGKRVNFRFESSFIADQFDYIMRKTKTVCNRITVNVAKPKGIEVYPIWFLTASEPFVEKSSPTESQLLFSQTVKGTIIPGNGFIICWRPEKQEENVQTS